MFGTFLFSHYDMFALVIYLIDGANSSLLDLERWSFQTVLLI